MEEKNLSRFGANVRKSKNEPFVFSTIYAESKEAAVKWFGEKNYEIDGAVVPRPKG